MAALPTSLPRGSNPWPFSRDELRSFALLSYEEA
jgi:hypothetical protein